MTEPILVTLKRGKSKPIWLGHPWVFSGAIHKVTGPVGDTGGPCHIIDERGNLLATGFYNPHARIAARLLQHRRSTDLAFDPQPFEALLRQRLTTAVARRSALGFPRQDTDVYRLVHSEGDLLSGLVVDRLGPAAVIQLNGRAMYEQRELIAGIVREVTGAERVALTVTETASKLEMIPTMFEVDGDAAPFEITENGIRYEISLEKGQKTGFYADQRENRARFAALCGDATVLDAYCYIGAFGLNAAKAGARHVVQVDSSRTAVDRAQANAALNEVAGGMEQHCADAVTVMKELQAKGDRFQRIVVDPPKLARGRRHADEALKKYIRINTLAMSLLDEGGLLLTCSCSQHVSAQDFGRVLTEAGHRMRRGVSIHATWSQPVDHPVRSVAPEGRYLKAFLVALD